MNRDPLTQARLKDVLQYDPESGVFTWSSCRRNHINKGAVAGGVNQEGYVEIKIFQRRYKAHRLAWFYMTGQWPEVIDHINRKRDDNRFCNLRDCSIQQNSCNTGLSDRNTSGYRGVSKHKQSGKWKVDVKVKGKKLFFGLFEDIELAGLVAEEARSKMHGDYASILRNIEGSK